MFKIIKSNDRGKANHGWLDARHTFSFGDYYNEDQMGFSVLRVINEDRIEAAAGFPTHGHKDMEIVTYIIEGAIEHKDSLGTSSVIKPGEIQRMSAGSGVRHSEFNHFKDKKTHLLQIWLLTEKNGIAPSYEQKSIMPLLEKNHLALIGSHNGREGSVTIHQDVNLYAGRFNPGEVINFDIKPGRKAWVQLVKGKLEVQGTGKANLESGDGLAIADEKRLALKSSESLKEPTEFLLFDLPA
jgi:redox-sensitive bicupin YhaK (pirin superfamily)